MITNISVNDCVNNSLTSVDNSCTFSNHSDVHEHAVHIDNLNILCLNVCGLVTKSQYPEFNDLIAKYDILCFTESKTDDTDHINLPGFEIYMKNRFKFKRIRSGGITLAVKCHLANYIHEIDTNSKYVKWFKLDKHAFEVGGDILFGIVYIPPENSSYCIGEPYSELEQEYLRLSDPYDYVCLLGDFNARTSNCSDFIQIDGDDDDLLNEMLENNTQLDVFTNLDIPLNRKSRDARKNNFGNQLLEMCKYNDLFICNGRMGDDTDGEFTCKNVSVVDYVIGSSDLLKIVDTFSVLEFSKLLSDAHRPLSFSLAFKNKAHETLCDAQAEERIGKFDTDKIIDFIELIDTEKIDNLVIEINALQGNNIQTDIINEVVDKTGKILLEAAANTFGKLHASLIRTEVLLRTQNENINLGLMVIVSLQERNIDNVKGNIDE